MAEDKVNGLNDARLCKGHLLIFTAKASINTSASDSEQHAAGQCPHPCEHRPEVVGLRE